MFDAISKLVESGVIGEETQKTIQEAWENKVKENKEQAAAELREEFAKRYEHDKNNMVEAIDKMMTDKLSEEITKFVEDRKALAMEKTTYKENVGAHSAKLSALTNPSRLSKPQPRLSFLIESAPVPTTALRIPVGLTTCPGPTGRSTGGHGVWRLLWQSLPLAGCP